MVKITKTMAMTTAYPSAPWMEKGRGGGGRGGGAGHASTQSRQEQPGSFCRRNIPGFTHKTIHLHIFFAVAFQNDKTRTPIYKGIFLHVTGIKEYCIYIILCRKKVEEEEEEKSHIT